MRAAVFNAVAVTKLDAERSIPAVELDADRYSRGERRVCAGSDAKSIAGCANFGWANFEHGLFYRTSKEHLVEEYGLIPFGLGAKP